MNNKVKSKLLPILLILIFLIIVGIGGYYLGKKSNNISGNNISPTPKLVVCTLDAKQCPDGSWVSRIPPDCEFAPCPDSSQDENKDNKKGFIEGSLSYPSEFLPNQTVCAENINTKEEFKRRTIKCLSRSTMMRWKRPVKSSRTMKFTIRVLKLTSFVVLSFSELH